MAYTADSNAPLRDVKKVQFGILSPDEIVRLYKHRFFTRLKCCFWVWHNHDNNKDVRIINNVKLSSQG